MEATRNKCIATSNKCLTSSNKKLLGVLHDLDASQLLQLTSHVSSISWTVVASGVRRAARSTFSASKDQGVVTWTYKLDWIGIGIPNPRKTTNKIATLQAHPEKAEPKISPVLVWDGSFGGNPLPLLTPKPLKGLSWFI